MPLDTTKLNRMSDAITKGITGALETELANTKMGLGDMLVALSDSFARVTLGSMTMSGLPADKAAVDFLLEGMRQMYYERLGVPIEPPKH